MQIKVMDRWFYKREVLMELGLFKSFLLKLRGKVKVDKIPLPGCTALTQFYVFKCNACNRYSLDYPHTLQKYLECGYNTIYPKTKTVVINVPKTLEASA